MNVSTAVTGAGSGDARAIEAVRALARVVPLLERASTELSLAHYRVLCAVASGDERAYDYGNRSIPLLRESHRRSRNGILETALVRRKRSGFDRIRPAYRLGRSRVRGSLR